MLRPLIIAPISALLGALVFAPMALAQMRGPGLSIPGAGAPSGFGHSIGVSFGGRPHSHSFGASAIFLGDPFYADYPAAPVTIPPQFVVMQPTPPIDAPLETKPEPLMIELQGNRYVRFGGRQQSADRGMSAAPDYAEAQ